MQRKALWVGLGVLSVYLATLASGLQGGDAGELATAAAQLRVAHPPGYPVYVLLGKIASLFPFGSVAAKLNVLAAICMAGAAALLARAAGVTAACLFAFSPLVWTWGTQAEVFSLNALFAAALLVCAVEERFVLLAFLFGLGLGNHQTLLLLGGPLMLLAPSRKAFAFFLLGISVYAVLPLLHPGWGDARTWAGFVRQVTRADYGSFTLAAGHDGSPRDALLAFVRAQWAQLLFMTGMVFAPKRMRWPLVVAWLLCVIAFHLLARFSVESPLLLSVLARFWILPLLIACFCVGSLRLPAWVAAVLILGQVGWGYYARAGGASVGGYARLVLNELPQGAILLTRGDLQHNALLYFHEVEHVRPDVTLLDQELMTYAWYLAQRSDAQFPAAFYHPYKPDGFSLAAFVAANQGREVFVAGGLKPGDRSLDGRYLEVPHGLTTHLVPVDAPLHDLVRAARVPLERDADHNRDPWRHEMHLEYERARQRLSDGLVRW